MKILLSFLLTLTFSALTAQKIGLQQFEYTSQLESLERKCDFFMSKDFAKESSNKDSVIVFVKRIYIKRTRSFDEEVIKISNDGITYSLCDPKKYATFKKAIEAFYKRVSDDKNTIDKIVYVKKRFKIVLTETEHTLENQTKPITIYNFKISNVY